MVEASVSIGVVGAGAWGTSLAQVAAVAGHEVKIFGRDQNVLRDIDERHQNSAYFPDIDLDQNIRAAFSAQDIFDLDVIILAVPAQVTATVLLENQPLLRPGKTVLVTAKGLQAESGKFQAQLVEECWEGAEVFALSGPSFAADTVRGKPIALTLAGAEMEKVQGLARLLASAQFRPYASTDLTGVQLAGALKNVYALGTGAVMGAGLGESARAAMIARAQSELERAIVAAGGKASTAHGLSGLGDLVLSCSSAQSRNFAFGIELGKGRSIAEIAESKIGLAEGVFTAPAASKMLKDLNVDAPLVDAVNLVLDAKMEIGEVVKHLMTRPLKEED